MKQRTWTILSIVSIVLMAAVAIVAVVMGGCSTQVETTSGYMPMKCHWTYIAVIFVGVGGAVAALLGMSQQKKDGRFVAAVATALFALVAVLIISPLGIGTCSHAGSQCNTTAPVEYVLCGVQIVLSLVMAAKSDEEKTNKPKAYL